MRIAQIFENNRRWVEERLRLDPRYFERLAEGQSPEILYVGCSDSRVTAEEVMGAAPGEIFVHRNIANLVPNNDLSALSVLNYAVRQLKVKRIIVCGHYYCGGVKAAMQNADLGMLNPWLRNIQDVFRLHKDELNAITDEEQRYKRLVELNVEEQCVNVLTSIDVQLALRERELQVHGWVFDVHTGMLTDLEIDLDRAKAGLEDIYRYR